MAFARHAVSFGGNCLFSSRGIAFDAQLVEEDRRDLAKARPAGTFRDIRPKIRPATEVIGEFEQIGDHVVIFHKSGTWREI